MERLEFDKMLVAALPYLRAVSKSYASKFNRTQDWRDIEQEVLLRMLHYHSSFDPDRGTVEQWGAKMIANRCIEDYTASQHQPRFTGYADVVESVPSGTDLLSNIQVRQILPHVDLEARLHYEGYNYGEIAEIVGLGGRPSVKYRIDKTARKVASLIGRTEPTGTRQKVRSRRCGAVSDDCR